MLNHEHKIPFKYKPAECDPSIMNRSQSKTTNDQRALDFSWDFWCQVWLFVMKSMFVCLYVCFELCVFVLGEFDKELVMGRNIIQ